jgi:putative two-component system response regulator
MLTHALPRKVLWIDDDPTTLQLGRIVLEQAGYNFIAAQDGEEGIYLAEIQSPQLILLDYTMSGLSGKEVFQQLIRKNAVRERPVPPVVMLTGRHSNDDERREMLQLGLAAYLSKPFGPRELINVIDNVLISAEIRQKNLLLELELRDTFTSVVRSLISLLAAKDPYTGEHSGAVLKLSEQLAGECGLKDDEIFDIRLAALLHDVGKIGVPESILCKPSRLTLEEKNEMDKHVIHGYQALADIPRLSRIREMVYCHHERWDGAGYPEKLKGDQIPIGARIVAVVDAFDAMTSDRPYRRGMDHATALGRLYDACELQFDPLIVRNFAKCLERGIPGIERTANLQKIITTRSFHLNH